MQATKQDIITFQQTVWDYFNAHRRALPWRISEPDGQFDPYKIIVSEIMLQQTQVPRVIPKFTAFIKQFPTIQSLAAASLADVLMLWSGLGYNRRAKFLWQLAQQVVTEYNGEVPRDAAKLVQLPGIGKNTAAAILAYSFNTPVVFIETNIRTVFLHHFFHDRDGVSDAELMPLVESALDTKNPREWYWALMDYGTFVKQSTPNPSRRSKHFTKQSVFAGSKRKVRGEVLKLLTESKLTKVQFEKQITDERLATVLVDLESEGLIEKIGQTYCLPK